MQVDSEHERYVTLAELGMSLPEAASAMSRLIAHASTIDNGDGTYTHEFIPNLRPNSNESNP